jgi:hypothetical protein
VSRSRTLAFVGAAALLLVSAAPVAAQDEATTDSTMDMEGLSVEVGGVEYAFTGLPTSLPAGTELTFRNDGAELHELVVVRIADGVTESLGELLAMEAEGRDPMAEGLVELVGGGPLIANPGELAEGTLPLDREGSYAALCFIPQGFVPSELEALGITPDMLGPDTDPADLPPEAQELMANPPHLAAGMLQEFVVTAEGTEAGELPEAEADEMAPEEESATEDEEAASE